MTPFIFASHHYPEESRAFNVVTTPKIWVNDKVFIDGAVPTRERMALTLASMIQQALDESIPKGKFRGTE